MVSPGIHSSPSHKPVLLDSVSQVLAEKNCRVVLDCTFGGGGYSLAFLNAGCAVYAIDRDPEAAERAALFQKQFPGRFHFAHTSFMNMDDAFEDAPLFDAIVFDFGVSSFQLDDAARGFSFQQDGPLDMRMSKEGQDAAHVVNSYTEKDLADIIYTYGGERRSRSIAAEIVKKRREKPFETTLELAELVKTINRGKDGIHPATLTFQALRIYVNNELIEIDTAVRKSLSMVKIGGIVVSVSFHELEDRIVKHCFKDYKLAGTGENYMFSTLTRKVITPSYEEIRSNPRARSARMRVAEKVVEVGR